MSTATLTRPTAHFALPVTTVRRTARTTAPRPAVSGRAVSGQTVRRPTLPGQTVPRQSVHRARLTRRGRVVLVLLSALLLLAAVSVGRTGSQAATAVDNGPALQQTTVMPGESLWTVAQRIAPKNDPREVVAQIRRINHLHSAALVAGQQLLLPTAG